MAEINEEEILSELKTKLLKNQNRKILHSTVINLSGKKKSRKSIKTYPRQKIKLIFTLLIALGTAFLVFYNVTEVAKLPKNLTVLLENPNNPPALIAALYKAENPTIQNELKQKLLDLNQKSAVLQFEKERWQMKQRIEELQKYITVNPSYPDTYALLSILYYQTRQTNLALLYIDKALSLDPNRAEFVKIKAEIGE